MSTATPAECALSPRCVDRACTWQKHVVLGAACAGLVATCVAGAYAYALVLGVGLALGLLHTRLQLPRLKPHGAQQSSVSDMSSEHLGGSPSSLGDDDNASSALCRLSEQLQALGARLEERLEDLSSRMRSLEGKLLDRAEEQSATDLAEEMPLEMDQKTCDRLSDELRCHAKQGRLEDLSTMLAAGVSPNEPDNQGHTALTLAAQQGHTECVKELLRHCCNPDWRVTHDLEKTPLMLAASNGHLRVVRQLLQAGADANVTDAHGWTALQRAADAGHEDVVNALLDVGADVSNSDYGGATALHRSAEHGFTSIVRALLDAGARWSAVDYGEATPLHWAAFNGRDEVVQLLLERGGAASDHLEARNNLGRTPLHDASHKNHPTTARLLLEAGALTTVRDHQDLTPLDVAASDEVKKVFG